MRIDELLLKKGAEVFIGAPANPLDPVATAALANAAASTPGILEAHLPQVFAPGLSEGPAQVLILVLSGAVPTADVMDRLGPRLHQIIPRDVYLDVWPLPKSHGLLQSIRKAGCRLWFAPRRPWWKFW